MRLIDIVYRKLKGRYNHQRTLMNASGEELDFLVNLLEYIETHNDNATCAEMLAEQASTCAFCSEHDRDEEIFARSNGYSLALYGPIQFCPLCGKRLN